MGKIKSLLLMLIIIANMPSCGSPNEKIELHEATVLLKEPGLQNLDKSEMHIALLPRGSRLIVLGKEYGKDYLAYKVETEDRHQGYVLHSDTMTVTPQ